MPCWRENSYMIKLIPLLMLVTLVGCNNIKTTNDGIKYLEVPVASWPEPAIYTLPKTDGIEYITATTTPGDVAKQWIYEATYWKSQSDIYRTELEMYKHENYNMKNLEDIIKEVNSSVTKK